MKTFAPLCPALGILLQVANALAQAPAGEPSPVAAPQAGPVAAPQAGPVAAPQAGPVVALEGAGELPPPPEATTPGGAPRVIPVPAVQPRSPAVFPSLIEDRREPPLAGIENGRPFLRDASGLLRITPSARVTLDLHTNPGAPDLAGSELAPGGLGPSFLVRRTTFEVSGEFGLRLRFTAGVELGGGRVGSTVYAGPTTSRLAPASATTGRVLPADAFVSYQFRRWLVLTAGQQLLPFSLSNRTPEWAHSLPERPLAIRGFAAPWHRDVGLTVSGDVFRHDALHYEVGVFGGDGYERPFSDALPEFAGRLTSRPLSGLRSGSTFADVQVGVSARVGSRDPAHVAYDYPTVATGQGWVLWQPGYVDSLGRTTHVLPSGLQRAFGGELRLPLRLPAGHTLDLQGEAYYVENGTREAVEPYVATNTERFGRVQGVGWYAQLSYWCCGGSPLVGGATPGHIRDRAAPHGEHHRGAHRGEVAPEPRGLELLAIASGIDANYDGATREGSTKDPKTPRSNVKVYQLGGGAQFWLGRTFRAGVHYAGYLAPSAGSAKNLVVLPTNVPDLDGNTAGGTFAHELTLRVAAGF